MSQRTGPVTGWKSSLFRRGSIESSDGRGKRADDSLWELARRAGDWPGAEPSPLTDPLLAAHLGRRATQKHADTHTNRRPEANRHTGAAVPAVSGGARRASVDSAPPHKNADEAPRRPRRWVLRGPVARTYRPAVVPFRARVAIDVFAPVDAAPISEPTAVDGRAADGRGPHPACRRLAGSAHRPVVRRLCRHPHRRRRTANTADEPVRDELPAAVVRQLALSSKSPRMTAETRSLLRRTAPRPRTKRRRVG